MEENGNLWKFLEILVTHGILWKLEMYGNLWNVYGKKKKIMGNCGKLNVFFENIAICGNL